MRATSRGKISFTIRHGLAAFALCTAASIASAPAGAAGTGGNTPNIPSKSDFPSPARTGSNTPNIPSKFDFPFLDQLGSIRTDAVSKFDIAGFRLGTSRDDAEKKIVDTNRHGGFGGARISLGMPMGMNVPRGFFCRHYKINFLPTAPNLSLVFTIHRNCEFYENSYSPSPDKSFLLSVIRYDQKMTSSSDQYIAKLLAKYGKPDFQYRDPKNPQIFFMFWGYKANTGMANYLLKGKYHPGMSMGGFIQYMNLTQGYLAQRVPDNAKCEALMKQRKEDPQTFSDHNGIDDDVYNCFTAAMKKMVKVAMTDLAPVMIANSTTDGTMHIYLGSPALYASQQVFEKYLGLGENYGPMHLWLMHEVYEARMHSKAHTAF
jgi:hypothetical protein